MTRILHLAWADLRRMKGWVLLVLAPVIATNVLGFVLLSRPPAETVQHLDQTWRNLVNAAASLRLLEVLSAYVFVLLLVQGDRTLGATAFWLTRPISGRRMVLAKAVTAAVALVVLPSLVSLVWWWWCGFSFIAMVVASAEFAVAALLIGVPAAFVSSLTDSLPRALLWGLLVVPIALVSAIVYFSLGSAGYLRFGAGPTNLAVGAIALATLAAVVIAQYAWRRPLSSLVVLFLGAAVTVGAAVWWPAGVAPGLENEAALAPAIASDVRVTFKRATAETSVVNGVRRAKLSTGFDIEGVPTGLVALPPYVNEAWHWPDRPELRRIANADWSSLWQYPSYGLHALGFHPRVDAETETWQKQRREEQMARYQAKHPQVIRTVPGADIWMNADLPLSLAATIAETRPRFDARLHLILARPVLIDAAPVFSRAWRVQSGSGLRVAYGMRKDGHVSLAVLASNPDRTIQSLQSRVGNYGEPLECYAVNERTREMMPGNYSRMVSVTVNSVELSYGVVDFAYAMIRGGKWIPDDLTWFDEAKLVRIRFDPVTRFTRDVTVESFPLDATALPHRTAPSQRK